ncbi:MAG: hypothetical protein HN645_06680 [Gemmatimonadales bacterium]|nr:hypothetical protein [Gemmatimonadales bacterium]MBT6696949.1 hypothetical protein [Gemmatimonadales bacterium]MBT7502587.1 hypothetical protein [Gemmatimonadales bacterium]
MRVPLRNEERHLALQLVAADAVVSPISGVLALLLVRRGYPARGSRGLGVALEA